MEAEARWSKGAGPSLASAIRGVYDDLVSLPELSADAVATRCFPNGPLTIVPLALGLATVYAIGRRRHPPRGECWR